MSNKCVTIRPYEEVVLLNVSEDTVLKFNVEKQEKAKNQECISSKASSGVSIATGQKVISENKKSTASNNEAPKNWALSFREQTLLSMKQSSTKSSTRHTEIKRAKKDCHIQQKNGHNYVTKQTSASLSQKKSAELLNASCSCKKSVSLPSVNNIPFVVVQDQVVQYPEVDDSSNRFNEYNPDFEPAIRSILEEGAANLKESSEKMKAMHESWLLKQEMLESQIQKQGEYIKEANQKQIELENHVVMLTQQLKEATRAAQAKDETISALKQQIKNDKLSENIISDLRTELAKQTELARSKHNDIQYLTLEKKKLAMLASCKDTLITKYKNTIRELQNQGKELAIINKAYANETNSEVSTIQTGLACSSPNSKSSDRSNNYMCYHNLSDISVSTVDHVQKHVTLKGDAAVKDSARFISLPDGDLSHTIMLDSYKNQTTIDEETMVPNKDNSYRNASHVCPKNVLHHSSKKEKIYNKENTASKMKQFPKSRKELNSNIETSFFHNQSKIPAPGSTSSDNRPIISDVEKQIRNTLHEMHNRMHDVEVPSPIREYPDPDWSDSSLPSVTTASELDIMPSNDS